MSDQETPTLPVSRNLKIGLFHLGSGMADVLATGVWNRIMISDLGFSATPIGLLVSLRYFLAPLGVWAGRMSDQRAIGGYRRLFWIWMGRALMVVSLLGLGLVTGALARGQDATPLLWLAMAFALLLFSFGSAVSGSTFLALVYDRAHESQRGRAVGLVWTFLLLGFSIGGILFGVMLPSSRGFINLHALGKTLFAPMIAHPSFLRFSPDTLQNLFVGAALIMGGLWFFSLLGEERRSHGAVSRQQGTEASTSLVKDLRSAWQNRQTRLFFWYLTLSMIFAFTQDLILEPFAGDVFQMDAQHTTRFAAYWGSMAIIGTLLFLFLSRRYPRLTNTVMCSIGVGALIVTFVIFALSSLGHVRGLVTPGLIFLGIGLGVWNVGTLGLMMDMSPFGQAGTFLGFWTLVSTLARGIGVSSGGIVRDLMLQFTGSLSAAYGSVFVMEVVGLLVAFVILNRIKVKVTDEAAQVPADAVLASAMD
jgi:MFS transporter, BCD family, chlorophyll transporter